MESLLSICQTRTQPNNGAQQEELTRKATEIAEKCHLDLSKPEDLSVGTLNPLLEACRLGNMHIVKMFVEQGATLNFVDADGKSPLYAAISGSRASYDNVAQLLQWGAKVNLHSHGRSPLLASFYSMNKETSKLLIKRGADVNNVILPAFCFVESVFALNSNLVMMASGVRFQLESFVDLVSLATEIVLAGLTPRTFYLCGRRFMFDGFSRTEIADLWKFQHMCLILGFKVDRGSLQDSVNELRKILTTLTNPRQICQLRDRVDQLSWTQVFLADPLPLTYLARIAIRSHLVSYSVSRGRHISENIAQLPVPQLCKDFLNMTRCDLRGIREYMY